MPRRDSSIMLPSTPISAIVAGKIDFQMEPFKCFSLMISHSQHSKLSNLESHQPSLPFHRKIAEDLGRDLISTGGCRFG
ncbi:hypothetical protein P8452_66448 [Trifolium repens]|nr:hypothetical protein P8452_66448 [Trifolium repens]